MTSETISPTNQPTTTPNLAVRQETTDGSSMDVDDESPSSMRIGPAPNDDNPNKTNMNEVTSSNTGHEKPMLHTEVTDTGSKVTTEKKKDGVTLGGKIENKAFALLTGLYEVRSFLLMS